MSAPDLVFLYAVPSGKPHTHPQTLRDRRIWLQVANSKVKIPQPGLEMPEMSPPTGSPLLCIQGPSPAALASVSWLRTDSHSTKSLCCGMWHLSDWLVTSSRMLWEETDFRAEVERKSTHKFHSWFDCPPRAWMSPACRQREAAMPWAHTVIFWCSFRWEMDVACGAPRPAPNSWLHGLLVSSET